MNASGHTPRATLEAYRSATGDVESVMRLVAEEALYFFSNQTCHDGKPAIRAAIEENVRKIKGDTYDFTNVRWLAESEDIAVCVYDFEWTGLIDGRPAAGAGRGTSVFQRDNDSWKVVHEHLSKGTSGAAGSTD